MFRRIATLFVLLSVGTLTACEEPAATTTLEVTLEGVGPKDVARGQLSVLVQLHGTCASGPCDPNPCLADEEMKGKTRCLGQGEGSQAIHKCECPAGSSPDGENEGVCAPDDGCTPSYCGGNGGCEENDAGIAGCLCSIGYTGTHCELCDETKGFYEDGLGGCTDEFEVCRAGQGGEAWDLFMADAESSLGHAPSELELVSANISIVEGSTEAARSWDYLWTKETLILLEPLDELPVEAATAEVPGTSAGLVPFDADVTIGRPVFTREPKFFEGEYSVGLRGKTERNGSEPFSADVLLKLEFNAY